MNQRTISARSAMILATLAIGSLGAGVALAHNGDETAPDPGLHTDVTTIGESRVLVEGETAGQTYQLIERDTNAGTCLALRLAPGGEAEACNLDGHPAISVDDVLHGQQYVFGLTAPDTAEVRLEGANASSEELGMALDGRARAFVIRVPGNAVRRAVVLQGRGASGEILSSRRFEFQGPQAARFANPAERAAEFDFHDH